MAMATEGNVRLLRLRSALRRTQEEIVSDLQDCANRMCAAGQLKQRVHFSVRQYSKWEGGKPPWPHPPTRAVLEEFFQKTMTELGFISPWEAASSGAQRVRPVEFAPSVVQPMSQRAALAAGDPETLALPVGGQSLPWLAPTASASGNPSEMRIGEAEVELLRSAADDLDAIDQQFGGNRLWRTARAHLLWVHQMIDRGVYDETLGQQLHAVAGKFTTSLGWFCYDAGLQGEARTYFSEALNTAMFTGDDALASRTLSNMARQAVDLDKGREAVRYARLAQAHATEWSAPAKVSSLLTIREAQGYARIGDDFNCEQCVRRAWQHWERGDNERDPDWTHFLNEAELVCLEGMCRLDLGQYARAQKLLARSAELQDIPHSRNRGMCLGRLSVAALANQDVHHSVFAAQESLRLVEGGMSSARNIQQLKIVRDGMAPHHRSREVGSLLEQIGEHIA